MTEPGPAGAPAPDTSASRPLAKVIVLCDLHMVPEGRRIIGLDPAERLAGAIAHINLHHADADLAVILGDLAHGGDVASYRRLRRLLAALPLPMRLMVGNHDHRASLAEVFTAVGRDRHGFVQSVLSLGGYRLLFADTLLDPPHSFAAGSCGHLCARRLSWLDAELAMAKAAGEPALLCLHHPPMVTGFPGMDLIRLANPDELHAVVARHGNVRHILAGHIHRTISASWRGIPVSILKSPVHQQPMDLVTVSGGLSVDEPGAYGIVLLFPDGVVVHTEDFALARHPPAVM